MNFDIPPLSQAKTKAISKLKLKKYRYSSNSFVSEGWRLFSAASQSDPKDILEIIINESFKKSKYIEEVSSLSKKLNIPIYICIDNIFNSISDEKSPSGLMFVTSLNKYQDSDLSSIQNNNCIYLENISDPGNLGTIIRTASWFRIENIFLSPNSVDPYNPKVVRASAGGIFNVKLYLDIDIETISNFGVKNNFEFIGTTVQNGTPLSNWNVSDKNIIFFGSEATGLTNSAKQIINRSITVSGSDNLESLNLSVTAGIVLNHLYNNIK